MNFNEKKFRSYFKESPIIRIGWVSFMRNIVIASGNSGEKSLISHLKKLSKNQNPIIRGACIWSLNQLLNNEEKKIFEKMKKNEKNRYVLYELNMIS